MLTLSTLSSCSSLPASSCLGHPVENRRRETLKQVHLRDTSSWPEAVGLLQGWSADLPEEPLLRDVGGSEGDCGGCQQISRYQGLLHEVLHMFHLHITTFCTSHRQRAAGDPPSLSSYVECLVKEGSNPNTYSRP